MATVFCMSNAQLMLEAHPITQLTIFYWPTWIAVAVYIVGSELLFYWNHRMLHTKWLFKHVHLCHHRILYPTAFDFGSVHPVESVLLFVCLHAIPLVLHIDNLWVRVYGGVMALMPILEHGGGLAHWPLNKLYHAEFHNDHHIHLQQHFGVGTLGAVFDKLFGTYRHS